MFDEATENAIWMFLEELMEAVRDEKLTFFEGCEVIVAPVGAPPEYITVQVDDIYDENVLWRGIPPTLNIGDIVVVWENPISHRREILGAGGAGGVGLLHDLLSATHGDTTPGAVVQGDLIVGDGIPSWANLAIGTPDQLLTVNAAGTDPVWASNLRQILELEFNDAALLTIAAGTVTRTQVYHVIAAQVGVADDLDNVLGGVEGDELVIRPDAGDTITVRHNQGGAGDFWFAGGANIALDNEDHLRFICDANGRWCDQSGGAGGALAVHNHSNAGAGGDDLNPETISQQGYIVGVGCPYTTLGAAIAAVNAAGPPAPGTEYTIKVQGGTTTEAGDITIPSYCTVEGSGENTIIDMQANTLTLASDSSLKDIIVRSSNATAAIDTNNATDVVLRNVTCVQSGGGFCFWLRGTTTVSLYHCTAKSTAVNARGFQVSDAGVALLWDCDAYDSTNFDYGLNLNNVAGTTATALHCRFQAAIDDVLCSANAALYHFDCQFDPNNSTFASGTHTALPTKRFNQQLIVAEQGGDFQLPSEAVAWINAQGDAAPGTEYVIEVMGGTYTEVGDITIPDYTGVKGKGDQSIINMGANTLTMGDHTSLQDLNIFGSDPSTLVIDDVLCYLRNVRINNDGGTQVIYVGGNAYVEMYIVHINSLFGINYGLYVDDAAYVVLDDCSIASANFNTAGLYQDNDVNFVNARYTFFLGVTDDIWTGAAATTYLHSCWLDAQNVTFGGTVTILPSSPLNLDGWADALILDADGDTTISAPTDDQIDIEIAGADDFRFTANKFLILAGSEVDLDGVADALVLDADGDTSISAPTDDKVDFEVGGADKGFLIPAGWEGDTFADIVKNTSGGAVVAGDVGYIDTAGEFKTTTTAYLDVSWAVVLTGGANNADVYVTRRGRVTVTLNGNCSAGDYLYTSTTAGQAQPQSYTRPELFAVALTANAGGAGGTCSALLLCHTRFLPATSSIDIFSVSGSSDTDWRTTINGAPAGAVVTYTAPLISGAEDCIDPTAANLFGKLRLYNETRGDYALIDDVNQAANTITLTANAPGAWANGDTITVRSQTCVVGAAPYYFDVDLSDADNTVIPKTARAIEVEVATRDTGAAGGFTYTHPWEAYAGAKVRSTPHYAANIFTYHTKTVPLIQRRFCTLLNASGAATSNQYYRLTGIWQAEP